MVLMKQFTAMIEDSCVNFIRDKQGKLEIFLTDVLDDGLTSSDPCVAEDALEKLRAEQPECQVLRDARVVLVRP